VTRIKYEAGKTEVDAAGLRVLIYATNVGALFGFVVHVPWSMIDRHALYDGVAKYERAEYERQRWDQGQDHPLF
jgi:hypothetical protein